jgi:Cof subfamily protein (haloacid dehalogenase superfamily)
MTKIQAVLCLDIDGTLIDSHEQVHPKDHEILKDFPEHIQPVIATGRSLPSVKGVLQNNGLFNTEKFPLPAVFMNGGIGYLPHEEICIKHAFSTENRVALVELSEDFPNSTFMFFTADSAHPVNLNDFGRQISKLHFLGTNQALPTELPDEIIKVVILNEDRRQLAAIAEKTRGMDAEMGYSLPYAYEINPSGITKGSTLLALLKAMHLDHLPIFAAGDAENDISLFKVSTMSFAPVTALPEIRNLADHVIERDGNGLISPILNQIESVLNQA